MADELFSLNTKRLRVIKYLHKYPTTCVKNLCFVFGVSIEEAKELKRFCHA